MKKILSIVMSLLLLISVPSFSAEGDIVDIAAGNSDFSILVAALQKAELVGALQGEGPFTVFAPTDAAFVKLLGDLGIEAEDLLNHPQLGEVLLYHVVSGKVMSTDLSNGLEAATLNGEVIKVDLTEGVKINSSNVVTADIEAINGVIHVIDEVLVPSSFVLSAPSVPETVVDIALSSEDFSMLVSLLQKADLVGALQGEGPFTVFAPTNKAFEDLLSALGISASDLMAQPDLAKVLLYHVVPGNVLSTDLSDGLEAATLNGESVKFDLSSGVKVNTSGVVAADIVAQNGVVHVVDSVLVPSNFVYQAVEADEELPQTGTMDLTSIFIFSIIGLAAVMVVKKRVKA
ncbi:MAG: fasciclin domain-containing protein [Clostridiales bacterium]|nr:fasciclin domain-containing protein [Clostridiales bacterium]